MEITIKNPIPEPLYHIIYNNDNPPKVQYSVVMTENWKSYNGETYPNSESFSSATHGTTELAEQACIDRLIELGMSEPEEGWFP